MTPLRKIWYPRLSTAASRRVDARQRAAGAPPGSPLAVAAADRLTDLWDLRAAHTLACGWTAADLQPNGLLPAGTHARRNRGYPHDLIPPAEPWTRVARRTAWREHVEAVRNPMGDGR